MPTITLTAGLRQIGFQVIPVGYQLPDNPGIYALLRQTQPGFQLFSVLYIGISERDLSERVAPHHEHWRDAMGMGMTHIGYHSPYGLAATLTNLADLERSLINTYDPPINIQHRSRLVDGLLGR